MGDRKVLLHNYEQAYDQYDSGSQGYDEDETSASILASVREQEEQFAKLTKEIEAERNTVTKQLQRSHNYAASLESISDTEESFPWRQHAAQVMNFFKAHRYYLFEHMEIRVTLFECVCCRLDCLLYSRFLCTY